MSEQNLEPGSFVDLTSILKTLNSGRKKCLVAQGVCLGPYNLILRFKNQLQKFNGKLLLSQTLRILQRELFVTLSTFKCSPLLVTK